MIGAANRIDVLLPRIQRHQRGDRVALMAATSVEWALCDLAITLAGAVSVPIYPSVTAEQAAHILRDSERLVRQYHDPLRHAMTRIALAPCSPFSVTADLMRESAILARSAQDPGLLQQRIRYTETGLEEVADGIGVLAEDERLPAHGAAIRARFA